MAGLFGTCIYLFLIILIKHCLEQCSWLIRVIQFQDGDE